MLLLPQISLATKLRQTLWKCYGVLQKEQLHTRFTGTTFCWQSPLKPVLLINQSRQERMNIGSEVLTLRGNYLLQLKLGPFSWNVMNFQFVSILTMKTYPIVFKS